MSQGDQAADVAERFASIARRYCHIVDSASLLEKPELLAQIYEVLPSLIDAAMHLPDPDRAEVPKEFELSELPPDRLPASRITQDQWLALYRSLKEKLGESDLYRMVFDAVKDNEAIHGSLADDIAEIYRDVQEGLVLTGEKLALPQNAIWEWRTSFDSHWGHHAMSALKTIHDIRNY